MKKNIAKKSACVQILHNVLKVLNPHLANLVPKLIKGDQCLKVQKA